MEIAAATLYGLDILFLIAFQFLNRDYGAVRHAISDFGIGKTAGLFRAYLLAGSIAAPLLAWQFWSATSPGYPATIPVWLLLVMVARLLLGLFPNDLRGAPRTRSGHVHHLATLLGFTCAFMTTTEATPLLAASVEGTLGLVLVWLKHVISIGFIAVVVTISAPLRPYFGLAERVYLYATALWFLTASLTLPPL